MNINNNIRSELFELLNEISQSHPNEMLNYYNYETVKKMKIVENELFGDCEFLELNTIDDFVKWINKLRNAKRSFSRNLSNVIIKADYLNSSGLCSDAISVLEDFICNCPSPFYSSCAQNELSKYRTLGK